MLIILRKKIMIYVKNRLPISEKMSPAANAAAKGCESNPGSEKEILYA